MRVFPLSVLRSVDYVIQCLTKFVTHPASNTILYFKWFSRKLDKSCILNIIQFKFVHYWRRVLSKISSIWYDLIQFPSNNNGITTSAASRNTKWLFACWLLFSLLTKYDDDDDVKLKWIEMNGVNIKASTTITICWLTTWKVIIQQIK